MLKRLLSLFTVLCWGLLILNAPALAGGGHLSATSEQLQALFVQRLVKYVSWPDGESPGDGQPFIVAATNATHLKPYFEGENKKPGFRLVQWPVDHCHVLVVNDIPDREAAAILDSVALAPVLTIGQTPGNLRMGVVVNFQRVGGKIKLQINPVAADKAGLFISSKLLRIARIYKGDADE